MNRDIWFLAQETDGYLNLCFTDNNRAPVLGQSVSSATGIPPDRASVVYVFDQLESEKLSIFFDFVNAVAKDTEVFWDLAKSLIDAGFAAAKPATHSTQSQSSSLYPDS